MLRGLGAQSRGARLTKRPSNTVPVYQAMEDAHLKLGHTVAEAQADWNSLKAGKSSKEELHKAAGARLLELQASLRNRVQRNSTFWGAPVSRMVQGGELSYDPVTGWPLGVAPPPRPPSPAAVMMTLPEQPVELSEPAIVNSQSTKRKTPAQDEAKAKIGELEAEINVTHGLLSRPLCVDRSRFLEKLQKLREEKKAWKQKLQRMQESAVRSKKQRTKIRKTLSLLAETNSDVAAPRDGPGQPPLEERMPELVSTLLSMAKACGAADPRRATEIVSVPKTLDETVAYLEKQGFKVSRSGTYLRFVPRNHITIEGRRHCKCLPIKLCRAQNNERRKNPDSDFAYDSAQTVRELVSYLGPDYVFFYSPDDKCRVALGITAATKQAPMLMHLEYKVKLPDHDHPVGPRHKLIPSVIAVCIVKPGMVGDPGAVSYSGPTFISIRSGKHDTSNAITHHEDELHMMDHPICTPYSKNPDGTYKPVIVKQSDSGPDEAARNPQTLAANIALFKKTSAECLIHYSFAGGRSAYGFCERRMAPLSADMAGLVLSHETYGSHLSKSGKTKDKELELRNFMAAQETLAAIWANTCINNHPTVTRAVAPAEKPPLPPVDLSWVSRHVRQSKYLTIIIRCLDPACCPPCKSPIRELLGAGFLPYSRQVCVGLRAAEPESGTDRPQWASLSLRLAFPSLAPRDSLRFPEVPFDLYCPSTRQKLEERICTHPGCGVYHPSKRAVYLHRIAVHGRRRGGGRRRVLLPAAAVQDDIDIQDAASSQYELDAQSEGSTDYDIRSTPDPSEDEEFRAGLDALLEDDAPIQVIENVEAWLMSPWEIQEEPHSST